MRKKRMWILFCIAMVIIMSTTMPRFSFCAQLDEGMPKEFIIPFVNALSGPYAPTTYPNYVGTVDFCNWYNATKGGLLGKVPIKPVTRDFGTQLTKALEAYEEFRSMDPKPPFVLMAFGNAQEALAERYVEDKIVGLGSATPTAVYHVFPGTWTFGWSPSYTDSMGLFIKWLAETWVPKAGERAKIAFLTWDNAMGRAPMIDTVREYSKKMGVEIVAEEVYGIKAMDVTAQLGKIKKAGANWVFGNTLGHGPAVVAKSAEAMGINNHKLFDITPGKLHLAGGPWSGNEVQARLAPKAMVGWICTPPHAAWTEDTPIMSTIRKSFKDNKRKPEYLGMPYVSQWAIMPWALHVVEETVKDVGWKNLNGESFREHLVQLRDHAVLGDPKFSIISISEKRPSPDKATLWRIGEDKKPHSIIPFSITPDLHPSFGKK